MFDRRSPEQERLLNDLWNNLVRASGAQDAAEDPLDPEVVETVRYLHDLGATPPPTLSRERVRRSLQESASSKFAPKEVDMFAQTEILRPHGAATNGWHPAQPAELPRLRLLFERPLAYLAAAAVLLIALGGIAIAYRYGGESDPSRGGPAIFAPASPSPETESTDKLLVEITAPAGTFMSPAQSDNRLTIAVNVTSIPAASSGTWLPSILTEASGEELNSVVSGTLTVTPDGPVQVVRASSSGKVEDMAAGSAIELGPGDTLVHPIEMQATWKTGDAPVMLVSGYAVPEPNLVGVSAAEWTVLDWELTDISPIPTGPTLLQMRRVEVAPDADVAPEPETSMVALIEPGSFGFIGSNSDGSITLKGVTEPTVVYIFSVGPGQDAATPTP